MTKDVCAGRISSLHCLSGPPQSGVVAQFSVDIHKYAKPICLCTKLGFSPSLSAGHKEPSTKPKYEQK